MQTKLYQDGCFPVSDIIIGELERYLNAGIEPGSFLTAVLQNNLSESFGRADHTNSRNLRNIIGYVRQHVPNNAWGSREIVEQWQKRGFL